MSTFTTDPIHLRERLDRLHEAAGLQELNPDLVILVDGEAYGPEMEAEADQIGAELLDAQADEAEEWAQSVPPCQEVKAYVRAKRRNALEAKRQLAESDEPWAKNWRKHQRRDTAGCGSNGTVITSTVTGPQTSARESHGSASKTRGSRRSTSRGGDSGDSSDSDEPGEAGHQLEQRCKCGCGSLVPEYSGKGRPPEYSVKCSTPVARKRRSRRERTMLLARGEFWTPGPVRHISEEGTPVDWAQAHVVEQEAVLARWDEGDKARSVLRTAAPQVDPAHQWEAGEYAKAIDLAIAAREHLLNTIDNAGHWQVPA